MLANRLEEKLERVELAVAKIKTKKGQMISRHARVRKKVIGTSERPRLTVFRSLNNMYAQIIDDSLGNTLVAASSIKLEDGESKKIEIAFTVGKNIAELAKKAGITSVVFDRGGYKYHGRVKSLADGAREGGIQF
jgi:large subunit ribosomal protein L18